MFKKNNKQQPLQINEQEISTIIGEGYTLTGEINGSSVIRIEGKIIGNINVDGGVVLGEKGNVEGNITSRSVIIYGTVHGNVISSQLEIKKTGFEPVFNQIYKDNYIPFKIEKNFRNLF